MNRKDRDKIDRSVDAMMKILDMKNLWPFLLEYKIYNQDDVNVPQWEQSLNDKKTMKDILTTIKTRGPHAYQNLIRSLKASEYTNIIDILENPPLPLANNNSSEINDKRIGFDCIDKNTLLKVYDPSKAEGPVEVVVRKSEKFLDRVENQTIGRYPMRSKIRGLVLIITLIDYEGNSNRTAAEHDERNLRELFQQMGFIVSSYKNLTVAEIRNELKNFADNRIFRNVNSCFVIISGHGKKSTVESELRQKSVPMTSGNMNENKELMFVFDKEDPSPTSHIAPQVPADTTARNYADILVAHSTLPGHVSNRDKKTGTWYIQLLCSIFMHHAHEFHIQDLFLMIDACMEGLRDGREQCQTSTVKTIGFNKHLYINPGLFEK
ncbi:hypothetical protein PV327_009017 [Microctonus hyperodae]|uniref:Uncharacterized protein n=1 Tax=Microctonus hyperodae TaxID=165561 RepID=A0AA39KVG6_MICHY|nr:hypothetical protein PV327_009017 [Microctonus hyperodae]